MEGDGMSGYGVKGRPRKQYCVRGHDTFQHGRDASRSCVVCMQERKEKRRQPSITLDEVMRDVEEMRRRVAARRGEKVAS